MPAIKGRPRSEVPGKVTERNSFGVGPVAL
jgi:hypothetical protein